MNTQLAALGVMVAMSLLWLLVNLKANAYSSAKTASFIVLWLFLLGTCAVAVRIVLGLLS